MTGTLAFTFELWRWGRGIECVSGYQEGRGGLSDSCSSELTVGLLPVVVNQTEWVGPASPGIDSEIEALLPDLWSSISPCQGLWVSSRPVGNPLAWKSSAFWDLLTEEDIGSECQWIEFQSLLVLARIKRWV